MEATIWVVFTLGLVLLVVGAEALVRGASRLAAAMGISPLVIGLTVVAFGTSAPEMAVSVHSALAGQADIAYGNVVGSNIFNVLFILGASAAIRPLLVNQQLIRLDVPVMIGVSLLCLGMSLDGRIGRGEGLLLAIGIFAYTGWLLRQSRREKDQAVKVEYEAEFGAKPRSAAGWIVNGVLIVAGLGLLVLGSRFFVSGAVSLARAIGLSELAIGLTIVSAGTSLPELATSVMASLKGERDIAVGNVVGSNIFNILAVLGASAVLSPVGVEVARAAVLFDAPVMVAVAVACLPVFFTGYEIARWEGAVFFLYYGAYAAYLLLQSSESDALPWFRDAMVFFVLPLTVLTLGLLTIRALRRGS